MGSDLTPRPPSIRVGANHLDARFAVPDDGTMRIAVRVLLGLMAGLGAAGLVVAVTQETADSAWTTGDVTWIGVAVVPLYAIGVFIAQRRPEHPQARRLLLAGSSMAVGVGLESLAQDLYRTHRPGQWFWLFNLAYQCTNVIGLIAAVSLVALFPYGVARQVWNAGSSSLSGDFSRCRSCSCSRTTVSSSTTGCRCRLGRCPAR